MKSTRLSNATVNAQVDAVVTMLHDGYIDLFDGAQPATADALVGPQHRLVSCQLGTPAFGVAAAGVAQLVTPALGMGLIDGDATWYRMYGADHATVVQDGSVGTSNANLVLTTTRIVNGAPVRIDSFALTAPKSA